MNQIVRAWRRYQDRPKYGGPDAVALDGEKTTITEEDHAMSGKLPPDQLRNVIRLIKTVSLDRVKSLRTATYKTLKRLNAKRDLSKARTGTPSGSDQVNIGSLVTWLDNVKRGDTPATRQVKVIDATCCRRVEG